MSKVVNLPLKEEYFDYFKVLENQIKALEAVQGVTTDVALKISIADCIWNMVSGMHYMLVEEG